MKIYRVIDNGEHKFTTSDRVAALEMFYQRMQKYEDVMNWGWIEEEEV